MTDLIIIPQAAHWQRLKRLVLDSVSSPITRRVSNLGLDDHAEIEGLICSQRELGGHPIEQVGVG
jgi:hypothetical protein